MPRTTTLLWCVLLSALVATGGGCASVRAEFPGSDPAQLWTALVTAAETPDYRYFEYDPEQVPKAEGQWMVEHNEVWTDRDAGRIEVYRRIARTTELELMRPLRETRTWRFQILVEGADLQEVTFRSRGTGVPGKAKAEGDRYFADVRRLLALWGFEPRRAAPVRTASVPTGSVEGD